MGRSAIARKISLLFLSVFGFGCNGNQFQDSNAIVDVCSDSFIQDYNSIVSSVDSIKKAQKSGHESKSEQDALASDCTVFYAKYDSTFACIAQRKEKDVLVKAADHVRVCTSSDTIDNTTKVPQKISPSTPAP